MSNNSRKQPKTDLLSVIFDTGKFTFLQIYAIMYCILKTTIIKSEKESAMDYEINEKRLREDLKQYFGTAMVCGYPAAAFELARVECASESELAEIARRAGMDMSKYVNWTEDCNF